MNKKRGRIFVLSAPSGTGKTTLARALRKRRALRLVRSASATTREARPGEKHGRDYFFVTQAAFERMQKRGSFLERAVVFGQRYGTPRAFVQSQLKKGNNILLTIDVQGALQVKKKVKGAVLIFVLPPSMKALCRRLACRRTDAAHEIKKRRRIARQEMRHLKHYDYVVVNDRLKRAVGDLEAIIRSQGCRRDEGGIRWKQS